jgi:hypothetical protein
MKKMKYEKYHQKVTSCYDCPFTGYVLMEENKSYCSHIKVPEGLSNFGDLEIYIKEKSLPDECPLRHTNILVFT